MKARMRLSVALLIGTTTIGCGRRDMATEIAPPTPPQIIDVLPAARSTNVSQRPEIRVQFDAPMDTTATSHNVVLRLDTQFVATGAAWDSGATRLTLRPRTELALFRTYTVRVGPIVVRGDGRAFDTSYFWQFRTTGVAPPHQPFPADGTVDESPYVSLFWSEAVGDLDFGIAAGPDSAAVARHDGVPRGTVAQPHFVPRLAWGLGATVFWSVRVHNRATNEVQDGPVWRFQTLPLDTPVDTVSLVLSDWSNTDPSGDPDQVSCLADTFAAGGGRLAAIRWDLRPLGAIKLIDATMSLQPKIDPRNPVGSNVYASLDYWPACDLRGSGPPDVDFSGPQATLMFGSGSRYRARSDALTAEIEAIARYRGFFGFLLLGTTPITYQAAPSRLELLIARIRTAQTVALP